MFVRVCSQLNRQFSCSPVYIRPGAFSGLAFAGENVNNVNANAAL
jgi:hypothetical protein